MGATGPESGTEAHAPRRTSGGSDTGNNQIVDDGTWTYTYDADGNLTKQVGDSGGSQAGNEIDYTYYVGNRLVEVKNLTDDVVTQDVKYTYDMFGNLIGRKFTPYSDGVAGTATISRFVFDPTSGQMVLAFDGSGNLTDRFLNGPAVDQILADEHYSSPVASPSSAGDTLWMLGDNQGTVRDIVDSSGLVDHLTYNAFGALSGQSGTLTYGSTDVIFAGYTGAFYDSATGMQWHNDPSSGYTGRWYNPALQRWMTDDPVFPVSGPNPYEYCLDGSPNATDASGLADVNTGVCIHEAYSKPSWFFSHISLHSFIEVNGHGYGFEQQRSKAAGPGMIQNQELGMYPDKSSSQDFYSTKFDVVLDDSVYNVQQFKQNVIDQITNDSQNPPYYLLFVQDCDWWWHWVIWTAQMKSRREQPPLFPPIIIPPGY